MSKQVTIKGSVQGYTTGSTYTLADDVATELVNRGLATWLIPDGGGAATLSAAYTVLASDNGARFKCASSLTVTVAPSSGDVVIFPPASGTLTIGRSGGVTLNGAAADVACTMANNRGGVAIIANPVVAGDFTVLSK